MPNEVALKDVDLSEFSNLLNPETANQLAVVDTMSGELAKVKELQLATVEAVAVMNFKHKVKEVLRGNKQMIMELQNSPMGFKTDRQNGGYDEETVLNCAVVALSYGCHLSGNQFNIIAGNPYITKEGYFYKLSQMVKNKGLNYRIVHGIAKPTDKWEVLWEIESEVFWSFNGKKEKSQKLSFIIKGAGLKKDYKTKEVIVDVQGNPTSLTTQDQIRGKADRKVMHWLFCTLTSAHIPDIPDEFEGDDVIEGTTSNSKKSVLSQIDEPEKVTDQTQNSAKKSNKVHEEKVTEEPVIERVYESTKEVIAEMGARCKVSGVKATDVRDKLVEMKALEAGVQMSEMNLEDALKVLEKVNDAIFSVQNK